MRYIYNRIFVALISAFIFGLVLHPTPSYADNWSSIAPKPLAIGAVHSVTGNDGLIYAFEDHYDGNVLYMQIYNPLTNTWAATQTVPTGRSHAGIVKTNDGKIWVMGGWYGGNSTGSDVVEVYDPATGVWECSVGDYAEGCTSQTLAPVPTARGGLLNGAVLGPDGKIYLVGGTGSYVYYDLIEAYDPNNNTWHCSTNDTAIGCNSTGITPLTNGMETQVITGPDSKIYTVGGDSGIGVRSTEVKAYDVYTNQWEIKEPMPEPVYFFGLTVGPDDKIYTVGGIDNTPNAVSSVQVYDVASDSWTSTDSYPTLIRASGVTTGLDGRIYSIGGDPCVCNSMTTENWVLEIGNDPITTTFNSVSDTYVRSGADNRNHGGGTFMRLQASGTNRSLVKFDQTALQTAVGDGEVLSAKLRVTIVDNGNNWGTSGRTIDVHRLVKDWVEGDGLETNYRGTGSGATWECAVDSNIANQSKNCSGTTEWEMGNGTKPWILTATDTETITSNQTGVVEFDVTADVQAYMNGTSNSGWIIKKTEEGSNGQVSFGTKESTSVPQLVVTYQP